MESSGNPLKGVYEIYANAGLPSDIHIDLTFECPLDCVHCFAKGSETIHPALMDTKKVKNLLDQAAELEVLTITFSGGEPLLRKDIWDLVGYARQKGFIVKLKTSGFYITTKDIEFIAATGLIWVDISLHGIRPETHDAVTRVSGSFKKAMDAIIGLHNAGVLVQVNSSALKENYREIPEILNFSNKHSISNGITMWIMESRTKGDEPKKHAMDHDEFLRTSLTMLQKGKQKLPETNGYDLDEPLCFAGRASLYAGPDGIVYPCVTWPEVAGDLKKQSLREIWFDSPVFKRIRGQFMKDRRECVGCNLFGYCNFCPGRAFQSAGNAIMPYSDACSTAKWTREAYAKHFGSAPDSPGQGPKNR